MGCDLVVALSQATARGLTLFGANCHRPTRECQTLRLVPGRAFAVGETLKTTHLELPQVRQSVTVLGSQLHGGWGYQCGVNEHRVALGCASWRSIVPGHGPGLTGPDLVRLALERSTCARQAVDVLTGLVVRHGQGGADARDCDQTFLIADGTEAYAVEVAGPFWAAQHIREARAVSDVAVIRQDWDRLAPGLSDYAIHAGWWQADGTKLDFADSLSDQPAGLASGLRRWGRATILLEQQNGHIDASFLRRLLADHYDGTSFEIDPVTPVDAFASLCQHGAGPGKQATTASLFVELAAEPQAPVVAWCAFGPPCICVHFPIFLCGTLPEAFATGGTLFNGDSLWWRTQQLLNTITGDPVRWQALRQELAQLQRRFEQDVEEVLPEARQLAAAKNTEDLQRLCGSVMQSHVERFEEVLHAALAHGNRRTVPASAAANQRATQGASQW